MQNKPFKLLPNLFIFDHSATVCIIRSCIQEIKFAHFERVFHWKYETVVFIMLSLLFSQYATDELEHKCHQLIALNNFNQHQKWCRFKLYRKSFNRVCFRNYDSAQKRVVNHTEIWIVVTFGESRAKRINWGLFFSYAKHFFGSTSFRCWKWNNQLRIFNFVIKSFCWLD